MKKSSIKYLSLFLGLLSLSISGYCIYRYFSHKPRFEERSIENAEENCEENCFSVSLNYLYCKGNSLFDNNFNE